MISPSSPATSSGQSAQSKKALFVAAVVFVVVTGVSFFFMRNLAPENTARPNIQSTQNSAPERNDRPAGTKPAASQLELQRERLLETVGSVSSIYLYQTYLNIGLLADAVKSDTYTKKDSEEVLNTLVTLLRTVDTQAQKLENVGLDDEEMAAVGQVRKVSGLLQAQASHLQAHWRTGDKTSLEQFQVARRDSWIELRLILGLAAENPGKTN
jgi:hypothetical protein